MLLKVGYARVSTMEQNPALQLQALQAAGCDKIFTDYMSGARNDRPGLREALGQLQGGDCLMVWKLDRLGRGVKGLVNLIGDLEAQGVTFESLTEAINTATPSGRLLLHVLAAVGQLEKEMLVERTQAGLLAARSRGRIGGRPRKMGPQKVASAKCLLERGMSAKAVAASLGVSVPTLYRWLPASISHQGRG